MTVSIRPAEKRDLPRLREIYNYYVVSSHITFDIEPVTAAERREWFSRFHETGRHRLFVAENRGLVAGYAGSFEFRTRCAYESTIETTVYCAPESVGLGIGSLLYDTLFEALSGEDVHVAIAALGLPNDASVALHERFGFRLVGVMHEVGWKFGRYWDVGWYEKKC